MPYGRPCDGGSSAERGEKSGGKYSHPTPSGKSGGKYARTAPPAPGQGNNSNAPNPGSSGMTHPGKP